ncbi:tyrosine-protein kinase Fyn-like [Macrobrachium rosenbergii]|uniref:tyrosine-protein kinase Fyn-like n=1 Tax=Macrobrachium rosenbergii TaxID=79674 RepID=UPI0034D4C8A0
MGKCFSNPSDDKTPFSGRLDPPIAPRENNRLGETTYPFVIAIHDFTPTGPNQVRFRRGDVLEIFHKNGDDWWRGRHQRTRVEGYIPVAYTAPSTSLESQAWYFGLLTRDECEALLMQVNNPVGAFLVRDSDKHSNNHKYTLSVKTHDGQAERHLRHYRIFINSSGYYFVSPTLVYSTINDLIEALLNRSDPREINPELSVPCRKPVPVINNLTPGDEWEIPREDLHFIQEIGRGNFSEVWLGTCHNTPVAIKTLMTDSSMTRQQFMEEAAIMKRLKNKNIVVLYGVCTSEDSILIITEYLSNGSLLDFLRKEDNQELPINTKIHFAQQVANGMCYLERQQLIHRDLAARNVLINEALNCKIADFGLARILRGNEYSTTSQMKIALKWTAPEAFLRYCFSVKSDVWSFGILCYEIFTGGEVPYPSSTNDEVVLLLREGYRMGKPPNCPDLMYETMLYCWANNPQQRPTFEFLLQQLQNFAVYGELPYDAPELEN